MAAELGTYLAAHGGGTLATDIFEGRLPDAPDACIAIIEYGGFPPRFVQEQAMVAYEQPSVQLLIRASTYAAARATAETVYGIVGAIVNATLSGTRWLKATPLQPPTILERDGNERVVFFFNTQILKAVS